MNKKLKFLTFLFTFLYLFSNLNISYSTSNTNIDLGGKLELGVKDMGYYIDENCEYTVSIPKAVQNWMYPGWSNPINLALVEKNNSSIDFYQVYEPNSGANAYAKFKKKGGVPIYIHELKYTNWRYGEVFFNESYMGNRNSTDNIATIIHEIGHILGLDDINNINSIMHYSAGRIQKKVTKDANDAIVRKYK